jgi:hypothetical protein
MPTPDPLRHLQRHLRHAPAAARIAFLAALHRALTPRKRGKDPDAGGVPVEPDRPSTLSGGAAAPLEFDEE